MGVPRRSFVPRLPRAAWVVLGGDTLSAIGSGLTLPFLLVYFNRVRDIDLSVAGFAVSMVGFASLAGNFIGGALADRIGARATLVLGTLVSAGAMVGVAMVREPWHAFLAAGSVGMGAAVAWPARDALLATIVTPKQRSSVFGVRHATFNAGLGIGGVIAATIVDLSDASSFELIYNADAASYLVFAALLLFLVPGRRGAGSRPEETAAAGGYLALLRDPVFVRLWVLSAVLITVGYGQYHSFFPAYATGEGGLSAGALAVVIAANTITVVAAQLFVLRLIEGRRRTRGIVLMAVLWGTAWAVTYAGGLVPAGAAAVVTFGVAMTVFAIGETLLSPTIPALVNDLAPDEARGRYNGANTLAWTVGFIAGPVLSSNLLDAGLAGPLVVILLVGCGFAAVTAMSLERHISADMNLVPASGAAESDAPAAAKSAP